ncbi:MAG: hypothetical protein ACYCPT_11755 [Acidimicrobiales bacterium]
MSWSVRAEGHAVSEAAEKKLFRLLSKVLRTEEAGTAQPVFFAGEHVVGNPLSDDDLALAHPDTVSEGEDGDEDEAQASLVEKGEAYPVTVSEPLDEPAEAEAENSTEPKSE